ncbi:charged multivesicular body protein 6-A-like [Corticium candelabrum]|uniref:charged multivesicular body protein 6-A-like n=1 Tax=Corticium candelabrum TaxID=121492 RepID=UPI002E2FC465|nr:charged multivesicular body protein 6-A-like [Corticium candelabrum]
MGIFFSRSETKKESRVTEQDRAVLSLKQQRDKLKQYQKKLTGQMAKEKELARKLLNEGKKERAKLLLKKKRFAESMIEKTEAQLDNLEQMVHSLEFAQIELQVVEGLKKGNESLNEMHKIMSLEDVETIMDDTKDAVEYQKQIDELLGQNLTQEDEDEVLRELEMLTSAKLDLPEVPVETPTTIEDQLPKVPDTELPVPKKVKTSKDEPQLVEAS